MVINSHSRTNFHIYLVLIKSGVYLASIHYDSALKQTASKEHWWANAVSYCRNENLPLKTKSPEQITKQQNEQAVPNESTIPEENTTTTNLGPK